jgi:hypothetical protein
MDEQNTDGAVQMQDTAQVAVAKSKTAAKKGSGDLIQDVAVEIEQLTKVKALHMADNLAQAIETDYFRLGGVLDLIYRESWFEGFDTFDDFVRERFGFEKRKADYLRRIYNSLVANAIPWEKVKGLSWTKLKDIAHLLTQENVDEWVAKVGPLSYKEMMALLKQDGSGKANTQATTDETVKMKFVLHKDQLEVVTNALSKGKAEAGTEFDSVALVAICTGYLGGSVDAATVDLDAVIKNFGMEKILGRMAEMFPQYDISVADAETAAAA